jgi:hypothetical protein
MRSSCVSLASFDAALSLLVFNFIPDPKKALLELRRVTRPGGKTPGGRLGLWCGHADAANILGCRCPDRPGAETLDEKHMPLCRAGALSVLWKEAGLENVREQSIDIRMKFESFAAIVDPFLLRQGPSGLYEHIIAHQPTLVLRCYRRRVATNVVRSKENVLLQRRYSHPVDKTTGVRSDHTVILTTIVEGVPGCLAECNLSRCRNEEAVQVGHFCLAPRESLFPPVSPALRQASQG